MSNSLSGHISLRSINPEQNRYRFYMIKVWPYNGAKYCVQLRWGRINTLGRSLLHIIEGGTNVEQLIKSTLKLRQKNGYRLLETGGTLDSHSNDFIASGKAIEFNESPSHQLSLFR